MIIRMKRSVNPEKEKVWRKYQHGLRRGSRKQGSLLERAQASLSAGCDIILHCSSILSEMKELAGGIKTMADSSWRRAERAVEFSTRQFARMDLEVARKELVRQMA